MKSYKKTIVYHYMMCKILCLVCIWAKILLKLKKMAWSREQVTWVWFGNSVGAGDASRSNLVVGLEWTAPGDDSYLGKGGGFCQLNNWIFSQIYPTWRQEHIVLLAMKRLFVCSQPLRDKDGHHLGELERGEFRQQGYPSPCLPHTHTSR